MRLLDASSLCLVFSSTVSALAFGGCAPPLGGAASARSTGRYHFPLCMQETTEDQLPPTPDAAAPAPPPPPLPEVPVAELEFSDLENTRWDIKATPREDSWLNGPVKSQEFTLLSEGSVVWGGDAGGFGTGGRWTLKDGSTPRPAAICGCAARARLILALIHARHAFAVLEVIRTTPLGLVTGRDYYMASARVEVTDDLQFELTGIIRSYNALYPVMVIAGPRLPTHRHLRATCFRALFHP